MKKILFMIPNLSHGGAEKVLVNLVNNMDRNKFDITVQTLFAGGVNEQFLKEDIKYRYCFKKTFRGNSQILKLFSPQRLYKKFIKEKYDIVVSFLEGPTARIVSGCPDKDTKLVSWIHVEQHNKEKASHSFKNYEEAKKCYEKFDNTICVSNYVKNDFTKIFDFKKPIEVLYNTNETKQIIELAKEEVEGFNYSGIKACAIGTLKKSKGFDRLIRVQKRLIHDGLNIKFFIFGEGPEKENLLNLAKKNKVEDTFIWLGYKTNPYKYISKCDLFVCASLAEGFSTATTEALILGVPVVTVEVSGMKEMLGENNEYGIVTENNEDALYEGIKRMLTTAGLLESYAEKAKERAKYFSTEKTTNAVEKMFESL